MQVVRGGGRTGGFVLSGALRKYGGRQVLARQSVGAMSSKEMQELLKNCAQIIVLAKWEFNKNSCRPNQFPER